MEIRDDALERAKAIKEAVARLERQGLPVSEYLAGLAAGLSTTTPAPEPVAPAPVAAPEPAPEPVVEPEPVAVEPVALEPVPAPESASEEAQPESASDSDTGQATEEVDKPVVRRGRPRR